MPDRGLEKIRERALAARDKAPAVGRDIDLAAFSMKAKKLAPLADVGKLPADDRRRMLSVGVKSEAEGRSGTFIQIDDSVVYSQSTEAGVEVMGIERALENYDWLQGCWWNAVPVDSDKYTAAAELEFGGGYFIRAKKGHKANEPVQSCLYLSTDSLAQRVHNIIMVEEDAELHVITGCARGGHVGKGLHIGVSEFYVKEGGRLSFTMIHNWGRDMAVRPRSGIIVDKGGVLVSNYICLQPAGSLQMYPTANLNGENAVARFYSLLLATPGSELDVGARVRLNGPGCRAEVVSRAVTTGGTIFARGDLVGAAPKVKGHLECNGLILSDEGRIHAIPELQGRMSDVDLSHEAAVGRISQEEIEYLMARGLSQEEAAATIVRGFLDVRIEGLPEELSTHIRRVVKESEKHISM